MKKVLFILGVSLLAQLGFSQGNFNYDVLLEPISVPNLQGLHSYAFTQHNGKWLLIGGRKDGVHARQPFAAFPQSQNNTTIYVVDVNAKQVWSTSLTTLPTGIQEQLQSTNMNFYQDGDSLYIIGGYAYSATATSHITFANLTSVNVPGVINAIVNNTSITSYFKQITDNNFAVTGGQLGKIGNTFYLVGGHRFDGQYNPMGNPTYTQTYTNQIRKFTINNSGFQLSYSNYSTITDAVHLRRRDYNLLPQIFPDGSEGYTISSGVFQSTVNLPFLYPVDITANGHTPHTGFNQYLSNYHSATACLYDSVANNMHSIFFGGMSQYYYQNGTLIQDNQVPFVKTISRLTRLGDSTLLEFQMPVEMPALKGASAEFIPNENLPHYSNEVIKLSAIPQDTILIGHIFGGISSPSLNPFSGNQTSTTSADTTIYAVKLIKNTTVGEFKINGNNPYTFEVFPNPVDKEINLIYNLDKNVEVHYLISNTLGQLISKGKFESAQIGENNQQLELVENIGTQLLFVTLVFDNKYFVTKKITKK